MSWAQQLKAFETLDDSDDRKWALADQFANAVGAQFLQGHQVVQNRTDDELELRGSWHNYPTRMKLSMTWGTQEWEMKAVNPSNVTLYFHWDPDAVPAVGQFSGNFASDWDDDDSGAKMFFGKGFYLDAEEDRQIATYQALPESVRNALVTYMISDQIPRFYAYSYGSLLVGMDRRLHDLPDPLNEVGRGAWLAGQVAWGLSQIDAAALPQEEQAAPAGLLHKMTCGYCRTLYLWSQSQTCPNCGAPPQG
jgi:hypothetical protein